VTQVRVATYNVFMGGRRGQALHDVVRGMAPDVLLVNESPKWPLIWRLRCRRLAGAWGMRIVAGGRPAGSNMVVASDRVQVEDAGAERIQQPLFQPRRGIAWAQLRIEDHLLGVVCCHLSLNRERRARGVERVLAAASRLRGPVIIGGDLNEPPDGPSWRRLRQAGFVDHGDDGWLTFPAARPSKRIDALLVRGDARVLRHGAPDVAGELLARASDHVPVFAVVDLA
jgi:endonuclease/exonuclease/phosphatase family metal-dependent hydrolase